MSNAKHHGLLRRRQSGVAARVDAIELFFDLVFVYAVTQISHAILHHLTPMGLVENTLIFLAVWWVWSYTSWAMNWLEPNHALNRIMIFVMMLAGLFMAIAIPQAFGTRGMLFAAAYVLMQCGRTAYMCWVYARERPADTRVFQRILIWFLVSAIFWIAGGFFDHGARLILWAIAVGVEYLAPAIFYWVPGLGRSHAHDWDIEGAHLAERWGLFIIIALGESLLVTGATFQDLPLTATSIAALLIAFISTVVMWWLYFAIGAERGSEQIAHANLPGKLARNNYTYLHLPIVAGIILSAVADGQMLKLPNEAPSPLLAGVVISGAMFYLLGTGFFKRMSAGWFPLSHLVALAAIVVLTVVSAWLPLIALNGAVACVLCVAAIWEWRSLRAH